MSDAANRPSHPRHGGDLAYATAHYGRPTEGWLDLSTGINPNSYPASALSADALARLPDRDGLGGLIAAARLAYGVPEGVGLIAVPGTELAIRFLPLVTPQGDVAIISPTYGSHADAWRNAGRTLTEIRTPDAVPQAAAIVVIGNPNNPDGRTSDPQVLANLARTLGKRRGFLIVDEAFADVDERVSLVPHLRDLPALVLRSLGKFYGLAGLRLGFVAGTPPLVSRLASLLGDWPVSGPALTIGTAALADKAWRTATRARLKDDAAGLRQLLAQHGLSVRGGTNLFALVETADAPAIHRGLAERGIWTRGFAERPNWLRLGLPENDAAFDRLDRALSGVR